MRHIEKISHAVFSSKGVYALLLGSGVSRPAQIPTGWEILLELLGRVAHLNGETINSDELPFWFKTKFSKEPTYSNVLEFLAATPAERSLLIREFFERKPDEEDENFGQPTKAHRSVARLVRDGYIKVIVTTNFDRLLEQALAEVGVSPSIIASEDDVTGALPLVHSRCTIIKVNGDYLDARIRNTAGELLEYGPNLKNLLLNVFDDFGLVITGWSGEWDDGLRQVISTAPSRRFTTFWGTRTSLEQRAKTLAEGRGAEVFEIADADSMFAQIEESISALESLGRPHPMSAKMAAAALKKYLAEDRYKIRLNDLVDGETHEALKKIADLKINLSQPDYSGPSLVKRLDQYDGIFEILNSLFLHGSHWGNEEHANVFRNSLQAVLNSADGQSGMALWINMQRYPALQMLNCAAMAAIKGRNYRVLGCLVNTVTFAKSGYQEPKLLLYSIYGEKVIERDLGKRFPGYDRRKLPVSEIIFSRIKRFTSELAYTESELQLVFDRAEYLLGLKYAALFDQSREDQQKRRYRWGPIGSFIWNNDEARNVKKMLDEELRVEGQNWLGFKHGLFTESLADLLRIKGEYDLFLDIVHGEMSWR